MLTDQDRTRLKTAGLTEEQISGQIQHFVKGFPFTKLVKPATIGDGIIRLTENDLAGRISDYETRSPGKSILKFVPASGAATRMFKDLYAYVHDHTVNEKEPDPFKKHAELKDFFKDITRFAFYLELENTAKQNKTSVDQLIQNREYKKVLHFLLSHEGLKYGSLPKAFLLFHKYGKQCRTALEEHLVEGFLYANNGSGIVHLHFTISADHEKGFKELINKVGQEYEKIYGIRFAIEYTFQKSSTDLIAVDLNNEPFREHNGSLVFRPGGHGALLENLQELDADLVFIKNIDNVVPDRLKAATVQYKKALAGILLDGQEKIFAYLRRLDQPQSVSDHDLDDMLAFLSVELQSIQPSEISGMDKQSIFNLIRSRLDRPLRVCGMVRNEGEPGGGPFWTKDLRGMISLQVVESSQVDMENPEQKLIFQSATHFNPVDLVCGMKNYKGEKFRLTEFRDPDTGFISVKSKDGHPLKAQELPGLWNGSMAFWNTLFVEVPVATFNPVKTVNDLLRDSHQ